MVCHFATQCCCGCSLTLGVKAILVSHLLRCIGVLAVALMNLVFRVHAIDFSGSLAQQTGLAAFALAGMPLILAALWGVYNKVESPIRLYWFYLVLSLLADMGFALNSLVLHNPCMHLPGMVAQNRQAFACGAARGLNSFVMVTMLSLSFYLAFIVLSYCEDMKFGGAGLDLSDLTYYKASRGRGGNKLANQLVGELLYLNVPDGYGSAVTQAAAEGISGSQPLFGGTHHEMEFPPSFEIFRARHEVS